MVTTQEIESMGWIHKSTAKDGGSKIFYKGHFSITNSSDNFLCKDRSHITLIKRSNKGFSSSEYLFEGSI